MFERLKRPGQEALPVGLLVLTVYNQSRLELLLDKKRLFEDDFSR